jgi:hypothetical protein
MKLSEALRQRASTRRLVIRKASPQQPPSEAISPEPEQLLSYATLYSLSWEVLAPETAYKLEEICRLFSARLSAMQAYQEPLERVISYIQAEGIIKPSPSSHIWYLGDSTPF